MFEDTLTYHPGTLLNQPFSELLAADLEDDARDLYARMASDIAVVAISVDRAPEAPAIVRRRRPREPAAGDCSTAGSAPW
jgi:hypothetical protein